MDRKLPGVSVCIYVVAGTRPESAEVVRPMRIVIELVWSYGLWSVLAAVFLTMHWFGTSCCGGGHEHRTPRGSRRPSEDEPYGRTTAKEIKE